MSFSNLKIGIRLGLGFGVLLVFVALLSIMALGGMNTLSEQTDDLYDHPFMVSTAVLRIDGKITQIRLSMRDAILAESSEERKAAYRAIGQFDEHVQEDFKLILERFSGDKARIESAQRTYAEWKSLIDEEIEALENSDRAQLNQLLKGAAAQKRDELLASMDEIMNLAVAKATEFHDGASRIRDETIGRMSIVGGAVFLLGALFAWLTTKSITGPLRLIVEKLRLLAKGDLRSEIESTTRKDEIGVLLTAIASMSETLQQVISEIRTKSENLSSASEEVSATSQSMSQGATEQAASVEQTSASLEQMTSSIAQNTENAKTTNRMADDSARQAKDGGNAVAETVNAMRDIAKKVGIIEEIAYKTNILALNAAIEAARAGEHGRGFAVVAAEVQKLAENSQSAAQEIGQMATVSRNIAEGAGALLDTIVPNIRKTADLVQEITAASQEQASGVAQVNLAMSQLDQISQQNASGAEELAATAEEVNSQAAHLLQIIEFFKLPQNIESGSSSEETSKSNVTQHHHQAPPAVFAQTKPLRKRIDQVASSEEDFVAFD